MNQTQEFILNKSQHNYGIGMLNREDAIDFIILCKELNIPIYGFDGFHKITNDPRYKIQIDGSYSPDYSKLEQKEAYSRALEFLKAHEGEDMLYEIVYSEMNNDLRAIRDKTNQKNDNIIRKK